ncbi:c-di-GMP-binding flagellar brake protein YcgR [Gracilibacillus halotolerans]|uniref:C-di-GMP-binding flagellar brake protein YcgR n=1 Tax=Gracilibacillus halotolerans TaxID=74386 RepID=A0A841RGR9_9BACI|nr:PilZ domain-containing protein [Gracilibacillus halotolerans]MBB6511669.1 c-di-GMP-binding flagellar brake protein YcgR [Gracilibacillus halotolerans]
MITVGKTLQLTLSNDLETVYRCRVIDLRDETIIVDIPINQETNRQSIFDINSIVDVSFSHQDAVYRFPSIILKKNISDKVPWMALSYFPDRLQKIQRREYIRVETILDVSVHFPNGELADFVTVTHDLSGGGSALLVDKSMKIPKKVEVDLLFILPLKGEIEYVPVYGETVRIVERKEEKNILSIKFNNMTQEDQQKIIQYCFQKQLADHKKGLV